MNELKKEPFRFEFSMPSLDWYEMVSVEIDPNEYQLFKLERRYGEMWWLIGLRKPEKVAKGHEWYKWEEKTLGRITNHDIVRFIEWAKLDHRGSRLISIQSISDSMDVLSEIKQLLTDIGR